MLTSLTLARSRGVGFQTSIWEVATFMSKVLRAVVLVALFGMLGLAPTQPSQAAEKNILQWDFKSNTPYFVQFRFYSRTFNRWWGPGGGQVWELTDFQFHRVRLECTTNEVICYGAWKKGDAKTFWGIGFKGTSGCKACCYTCGQDTENVTFAPR
jgi:hypothetical protein